MYKSIIEQVCSDIQTQYENDMVKVVQSYGFNVDKEELAKALAYDRHQYEKGYEDGKREMLEKTGRLEHFEIKADGTLFIEGDFETDKVTRVLLSNPRTHIGGLLYWD